MTFKVTESNTRQNTFKTIYTLINDNKISGSHVLAGFSNTNVKFPCYVIQPALVPVINADIQGTSQDFDISIEIELWCTSQQLKAKIDELRDNIFTTLNNNNTYLNDNNLTLAEDWFEDSNVDTVEIDQVKYHTAGIMLRFKLC